MKLSEEILEKIHTAGYVVFYIITLPGFRLSRHNVLFTFSSELMSGQAWFVNWFCSFLFIYQ